LPKNLGQTLEAIDPPLKDLINSFDSSFEDYLKFILVIEKIKFVAFLTCLLVIFLFLWVPYLKRLSMKIFRTKGMLNMIPMDIISKSEQLKYMFTSGSLLNAVK